MNLLVFVNIIQILRIILNSLNPLVTLVFFKRKVGRYNSHPLNHPVNNVLHTKQCLDDDGR